MWRKKNYRKNAAKIIAAQRHRWLAKPRECAVCKEIFQPIKNSKACLKCREEFRKSQAHQYYLDNPENWTRSNAKRTERARAERVPTIKICVNCGERFEIEAKFHKVNLCPECRTPENRRKRQRHMDRLRYADDLETSRAKGRANARKLRVNNPEKYNARVERRRQKRLAKPTPTGRKFTPEHRANLSAAAKQRYAVAAPLVPPNS
jgi:hypothetical protein